MLDVATRCRRAHYRAWRRGTRELDFLLGNYASKRLETKHIDRAWLEWLEAFEVLLDQADSDIYDWLMDEGYQGEHQLLIKEIRAFHDAY